MARKKKLVHLSEVFTSKGKIYFPRSGRNKKTKGFIRKFSSPSGRRLGKAVSKSLREGKTILQNKTDLYKR